MSFKHISTSQTQAVMSNTNAIIADIRDVNSFSQGHIPGSEHLSNASIGEFMQEKEFDQPIIIVCYHGISSQGAANYLIEQGFEDVSSMDGGFTQWQSDYPELIEK